jgi:hypothetical protein
VRNVGTRRESIAEGDLRVNKWQSEAKYGLNHSAKSEERHKKESEFNITETWSETPNTKYPHTHLPGDDEHWQASPRNGRGNPRHNTRGLRIA